MYALFIALFLTVIYFGFLNPSLNADPLRNPSPITEQFESNSFAHAENMAQFVGGMQRMIALFETEPTKLAPLELEAELVGGGGQWAIDYGGMNGFLAASAYATGVGLTRDRLFPPNYAPAAPWQAVFLEQSDGAGVGTGRIGALVVWADWGDATLSGLDKKYFVQGLSHALFNTPNVGINKGGQLAARGVYAASALYEDNDDNDPTTWNYIPGSSVENMPGVVPGGAVVYFRCYRNLDDSAANDMCDG